MNRRDRADDVAARVRAEIEALPRTDGRDPVPPHALLDLPEPARPPSRAVAALVLAVLLALAGLVELRQRLAPPSAEAAPPRAVEEE